MLIREQGEEIEPEVGDRFIYTRYPHPWSDRAVESWSGVIVDVDYNEWGGKVVEVRKDGSGETVLFLNDSFETSPTESIQILRTPQWPDFIPAVDMPPSVHLPDNDDVQTSQEKGGDMREKETLEMIAEAREREIDRFVDALAGLDGIDLINLVEAIATGRSVLSVSKSPGLEDLVAVSRNAHALSELIENWYSAGPPRSAL